MVENPNRINGQKLEFGNPVHIAHVKKLQEKALECKICTGSGMITAECSHCDGSGEQETDCEICNGTGKIEPAEDKKI